MSVNVSKSAIKTFEVLQKLCEKDCSLAELADGFSDDTLRLYLNVLKNNGVKIISPNKKKKNYSLVGNLDFLNFNSTDFKILSEIKNIMAQKSDYNGLISFHNLLKYLMNYTNIPNKTKLDKIISAKPFGLNMHNLIMQIESAILSKFLVLLLYSSSNSSENFYKIMPKYLRIENCKIYLYGYDYVKKKMKYLPLQKVKEVKILEDVSDCLPVKNVAVCEFFGVCPNLSVFENYEITEEKEGSFIAQIYFSNEFHFVQNIFNFGQECKILSPQKVKEFFINKIRQIGDIYE